MNFRQNFELKKLYKKQNNLIFYFSDSKKTSNLNQVFKKLPKKTNFIFRNYDSSQLNREILLQNFILSNRTHHHQIYVGKNFNLAHKYCCYGLHHSDFDFYKSKFSAYISCYKARKIQISLSLSIHSVLSAKIAKQILPNIIFLSPIFPSTSHLNEKPLGFYAFLKFRKLLHSKYNFTNIIALGGINLQNLSKLNIVNVKGFGAIDFFNNL